MRIVRYRLLIPACLLAASTGWGHGTADVPEDAAADRRIEFPDTAEHQTLVVDLHTHTVFSDGHVWPVIRVEEALRDGLDAMAVTEHLEWQPHLEDIPHPDRNRAYQQSVASLPEGAELIVIPGSEITRAAPHGHMNAVFVADANALHRTAAAAEPFDPRAHFRTAGEWPAQDAIDAANAQGAFVFWNHSWGDFPNAKTEITEFHRANAASGKLHGIEIANGDTYSQESFRIALDHDLALIGVSDVHNLIDWDYAPHLGGHRPVNLVFVKERSSAGIREALFARRTVVYYEDLLIGRPRDLLPLLRATLTVAAAAYLPERDILEVTLANASDAPLSLRNLTDYTFTGDSDIVDVPAHAHVELRVRTGARVASPSLRFEVLSALTAPGEHPTLELAILLAAP